MITVWGITDVRYIPSAQVKWHETMPDENHYQVAWAVLFLCVSSQINNWKIMNYVYKQPWRTAKAMSCDVRTFPVTATWTVLCTCLSVLIPLCLCIITNTERRYGWWWFRISCGLKTSALWKKYMRKVVNKYVSRIMQNKTGLVIITPMSGGKSNEGWTGPNPHQTSHCARWRHCFVSFVLGMGYVAVPDYPLTPTTDDMLEYTLHTAMLHNLHYNSPHNHHIACYTWQNITWLPQKTMVHLRSCIRVKRDQYKKSTPGTGRHVQCQHHLPVYVFMCNMPYGLRLAWRICIILTLYNPYTYSDPIYSIEQEWHKKECDVLTLNWCIFDSSQILKTSKWCYISPPSSLPHHHFSWLYESCQRERVGWKRWCTMLMPAE